MEKRKFDATVIKYMSIFGTITRTDLKDCIEDKNILIFIVEENQAGKAIGKRGANVQRLEKALNKKIKIVEFNKNPLQFIKNLVYPNKVTDIIVEDKVYTITPADSQSRSMLIGRNAVNLRNYENIIRRYIDVVELKVK